MSVVRSMLVALGLCREPPCAKSGEPEESEQQTTPMLEGESGEQIYQQWRGAIHKNRNLQQVSVQIARRSAREWNNAERLAAKAIAEIQRRHDDEDR